MVLGPAYLHPIDTVSGIARASVAPEPRKDPRVSLAIARKALITNRCRISATGNSSRNSSDSMSVETEDTELENVLQQIFMECNAFISTPDSTSDAIPIIRFFKYVQDQLPNLSIDSLEELWRCLTAVSTSNRVNLHQFKEATKCWIAKIQQDSNSNAREKLYFVSDADSSMKTMDVERDIVELELREKLRVVSEENIFLRDELERYQASIDSFRQQCSTTENKLKYYIQKCQDVERENDEQKVKINELNEKEETMSSALRKYMKENEKLKKKLEAAQIEVHTISSLEEKLEKITKEKMDCMKKINKMQKEVNEKDESCKQLEAMVINFKGTNNNMKESYERDLYELREKNRELMDKNAELLSLSSSSVFLGPQERLSISPIPVTDRCNMHSSTPYKSEEVPVQDSLYAELKTSGFTFERSREDDIQALEEELNEYDAAISATLEDLEKVKQFFVTVRGFIDDSSYSRDTNERANKVNELKHKAAFLLHMAEEEITRRDTRRDASTQLRADPANAAGSLDQLGVRSFRDLLHTYRSIHTLSSSLTTDDSRWRTFGYQNLETDAPSARGDGLTQEDRSEKSTLVAEARSVSEQEDPGRFEENRLCEMPKVPSVLRMDSKATLEKEEEEKASEGEAKSFQVPEVSSASTPTSPRRKISVYYRSFDVVAVQDQRKDQPGSNLEVRQSPSNPDDSPVQVEGTAARNVYRNMKSDSDSSNSTPRKFQDSLLDDEPPLVGEPILRKVHLAPTRLKFSHEAGNELARTVVAPNCASSVPVNSTELDISELPLSPIGEHKEDDDTSVHSASTVTSKCKMEVKSVILGPKSCSNKNVSQACSMPNRRLLPCSQADSAKIADTEDPHSQASVRRVDSESQSRIERSVDSQMSSREDSLAVSGSEPATGSDDRRGIDEKVAIEVGKAVNVVSSTSLADPVSTRVTSCKNVAESDEKGRERDVKETKQEIKQWLKMNRSFSEGENLARPKYGCACRLRNPSSTPESCNRRVFPSLTEVRLRESGLANLPDSEEGRENLSELELQKKYTAFALCLSIDRLTLPRRIAMSCRQRDQSERNLSCEVRKMQQDIQEIVRQRNSVSGRMTLRRPSFSSECPKEIEKLNHIESSNNIGELRGIFEQTESRRSSREENNDVLRLSHSNNSQSAINCGIIENEVWTNGKEISPELSDNENINSDRKSITRSSFQVKRRRRRRQLSIWHIMVTSIFIFCLILYVIQAMSLVNTCHESLNEWLIRGVFDRYRQMRSTSPHPM